MRTKTKQRELAPDLLTAAGVDPEKMRAVIEVVQKGAGSTSAVDAKRKPPRQDVAVRQPEQPPAEVAPNMLFVIARAAGDPKVDPEKMRALLDMQKEIRAEEARISFTRDFIRMKPNLPRIDAKGKIVIESKAGRAGQKTPYARYNDIHEGVTNVLCQYGFAISFETEPAPAPSDRLFIRTILKHKDGHSESTTFPFVAEGSGSKNGAQAWGSSFSYGKRYGVIALLDIISEAPEDADDDGRAAGKLAKRSAEPEPKEVVFVSPQQVAEMVKAIEDCGVPLETVCAKYEVDDLKDLPLPQFASVLKACATFKAARAAKSNG